MEKRGQDVRIVLAHSDGDQSMNRRGHGFVSLMQPPPEFRRMIVQEQIITLIFLHVVHDVNEFVDRSRREVSHAKNTNGVWRCVVQQGCDHGCIFFELCVKMVEKAMQNRSVVFTGGFYLW
eukprot:1060401-Pleurochrysis_carterae.AAC.2